MTNAHNSELACVSLCPLSDVALLKLNEVQTRSLIGSRGVANENLR